MSNGWKYRTVYQFLTYCQKLYKWLTYLQTRQKEKWRPKSDKKLTYLHLTNFAHFQTMPLAAGKNQRFLNFLLCGNPDFPFLGIQTNILLVLVFHLAVLLVYSILGFIHVY